jgi:hypothetical protein
LGEDINNEMAEEMIKAADIDEDCKVSKDEFMRVMRKMNII